MAKRTKSLANGRPRRRGTKDQTREQLIRAILELLHAGGEDAVTTVSVTRTARLAQSMFYQHFANVEECLAVAAERITNELREAVALRRQRMYDAGPGAGEDLERFYRDTFALASHQRPIVQLFLRHRSDPLALKGVLYRFGRGLSSDLAGQLGAQLARAGCAAPPGWVEAVAENLMAASLATLEAFLEGRGPSVEESARLLAAFSTAACLGVIEAMPKSRAGGGSGG